MTPVFVQVAVLAYVFSTNGGSPTDYVVCVGIPLAASMLIVYATDRLIQRPVSVLLFLGLVVSFVVLGNDPIEDGVRWVSPLLCLKYVSTHKPTTAHAIHQMVDLSAMHWLTNIRSFTPALTWFRFIRNILLPSTYRGTVGRINHHVSLTIFID